MSPDAHRSHAALAQAAAPAALVDLLVSHVDQAYTTAGLPGALSAVRDLFRRMDPDALQAMVYELELNAEPLADPGERR